MIPSGKRYKVIGCEVLFREVNLCAAESPLILDIEFFRKGLHDAGEKVMSGTLQEAIDRVNPETYEGILLAYALCCNGTVGITAKVPMVIPRAHDCITLLLGSRERYRTVYDANPGTYFTSSGWIERNTDPSASMESTTSQLGIHTDYREYAEKYGEENAQFIMESIGQWLRNYRRAMYIDTGLGDRERYRRETEAFARENNLQTGELPGDLRLLKNLLAGNWNEDEFLIVESGSTIRPSWDERVIRTEKIFQGD